MYVFQNNIFQIAEDLHVSINDRGFRFGDGIFETIFISKQKIYNWQAHYKRFYQGIKDLKLLQYYKIKREKDELFAILNNENSLKEICDKIIKENAIDEGFIKIILTRGEGGKGYRPTYETKPTLIIDISAKKAETAQQKTIWLSEIKKMPQSSLPSANKLMHGLNSTLAIMQAEENKCDDALLLTQDGDISECASGNIFFVKNGQVFTPSLDCDCVAGTIRERIIEIFPRKIKRGKFTLNDLVEADEAFFTNVNVKLAYIKELHGKNLVKSFLETKISDEISHLIMQDIAKL